MDIEQPTELNAYLSARLGAAAEGFEQRVLAGGVSSKTVWVRFRDGREWVLKQALARLRVASDWFSDPARIHREAAGMNALHDLLPPGSVTKLIFDDPKEHVIAMSAVRQPHANLKQLLMAGDVEPAIIESLSRLLAALHGGTAGRAGDFEEAFDQRFFQTLRIEPYYGVAALAEPRAAAFLRNLIRESALRQQCLVHGDFSPKNVLVHHGQPVLLDHEVIHWGDPGFDLGFFVTHLLSKFHHLRTARPMFLEASRQFGRSYFAAIAVRPEWRRSVEPMAVRHTLGCLLARVAGRSPLEYLSDAEKSRQREVVCRLMAAETPRSLNELIERFAAGITADEA